MLQIHLRDATSKTFDEIKVDIKAFKLWSLGTEHVYNSFNWMDPFPPEKLTLYFLAVGF